MRRNYIVTYDICDPKRLRKVFKICKGFGRHLQLSVFECDLNSVELIEFEYKIKEIINENEDQVLFIDLGLCHARGELIITALGQTYSKTVESCFVA